MNPQQQHEYDLAMQKGHQHFYEHIPIYKPQLLDLLNAIKKKKPDLIVVGGSRQMGHYVDNILIHTYRALDLAHANLPTQVVGSIGFDGESYSVTSRLIENARFSPWSSYDHRTKKSKHMNKVVKEAIGVLLPTQFQEVVAESRDSFQRRISDIRDNAVLGMRRTLNGTMDYLRDELFHMVASGYVPKNSQFKDAMEYVVSSKEEYERNQNYNPERAFVWIKPDCVMYGKDDKSLTEVKSTDDLPEDMRGKLFVLMVADKGTFIDDVGMKADDNKFWVIL